MNIMRDSPEARTLELLRQNTALLVERDELRVRLAESQQESDPADTTVEDLLYERDQLKAALAEARERIAKGAEEEYSIADLLKAAGIPAGGTLPEGVRKLADNLSEARREQDRWFGVVDRAWTAVDETVLAEPDESLDVAVRQLRERAESAESALAALKAQGACAGWLPIGSAPKDGTRIVGYAPRTYGHAYWACLRWQSFSDGSAGWVGGSFASDPDGAFSAFVTPTHWLPLPVAPVAPTPEG